MLFTNMLSILQNAGWPAFHEKTLIEHRNIDKILLNLLIVENTHADSVQHVILLFE